MLQVVAEEWGCIGRPRSAVDPFHDCIQEHPDSARIEGQAWRAYRQRDRVYIFLPHVVNIGMAVGIMPVTGLPLCFRFLWRIQPVDVHDCGGHADQRIRSRKIRLLIGGFPSEIDHHVMPQKAVIV